MNAPSFVNTLTYLEFSKAYWLRITDTTTLRLRPVDLNNAGQNDHLYHQQQDCATDHELEY